MYKTWRILPSAGRLQNSPHQELANNQTKGLERCLKMGRDVFSLDSAKKTDCFAVYGVGGFCTFFLCHVTVFFTKLCAKLKGLRGKFPAFSLYMPRTSDFRWRFANCPQSSLTLKKSCFQLMATLALACIKLSFRADERKTASEQGKSEQPKTKKKSTGRGKREGVLVSLQPPRGLHAFPTSPVNFRWEVMMQALENFFF